MKMCDCGYATNLKKNRCCHCQAMLEMPDSWPKVWRVVYHVTATPGLSFQMFVPGADELEAMSNFEKERPVGRTVDSFRQMFPKALLNEHWTIEELMDASHVYRAVCSGDDCCLPIEEMQPLKERGLVTSISPKPGRGRYAGRYEFMWTDKLERLVRAFCAARKEVK